MKSSISQNNSVFEREVRYQGIMEIEFLKILLLTTQSLQVSLFSKSLTKCACDVSMSDLLRHLLKYSSIFKLHILLLGCEEISCY